MTGLILAGILFLGEIPCAYAGENTQVYDRVIIFGMDGVGAAIREANTPNFDRIFADGRVTYEAISTVTVSAPAWGAMFYGVPGDVHGTSNEVVERIHQKNCLYPSIFKLVRKTYPDAHMASFSNWGAINWGLIEPDCGADLFPDDRSSPSYEAVVSELMTYLDESSPKLLFVYFGDMDNELHAKGYGSREHLEAITEADRQIGLVYDELEKKGLLKNSLVMFVTDHGGNGAIHGGLTDAETHCTFAVAGPGLEKEGSIGNMELQDVAAITLYALGVEQPEIQTARVPTGIFPGVGEESRKQSRFPELIRRYAGYQATTLPEEPLPEALLEKRVYYQSFDERKVYGLNKKKELVPGLFGNAMNMSSSYLVTGVRDSTKWSGLTIAFWFRDHSDPETTPYDSDPIFVTDKNWRYVKNKGFVTALRNRDNLSGWLTDKIQIHVADEKGNRKDILWNLPEDYREKWIHCLVVFDPSTGNVSLYCDFELAGSAQLLPEKQKAWITGRSMVAGQSVSGKYTYNMEAEMDELMIFNYALTEEEIAEIRDWYDSAFEKDGHPARPD